MTGRGGAVAGQNFSCPADLWFPTPVSQKKKQYILFFSIICRVRRYKITGHRMKLARLIVVHAYARVTSCHFITARVHNRNLILLNAVFFTESNEHIFKYFR